MEVVLLHWYTLKDLERPVVNNIKPLKISGSPSLGLQLKISPIRAFKPGLPAVLFLHHRTELWKGGWGWGVFFYSMLKGELLKSILKKQNKTKAME